MKFIFVKFVILDSKNFEIIRYISFSIDFYEQETKRVCICIVISGAFQFEQLRFQNIRLLPSISCNFPFGYR